MLHFCTIYKFLCSEAHIRKVAGRCRHEWLPLAKVTIAVSFRHDFSALTFAMLSFFSFMPKHKVVRLCRYKRRTVLQLAYSSRAARRIFQFIIWSYFNNPSVHRDSVKKPKKVLFHNGLGIVFRNKSVANNAFFDEYVYGIVDADLSYDISVYAMFSSRVRHVHNAFSRLGSSLLFAN